MCFFTLKKMIYFVSNFKHRYVLKERQYLLSNRTRNLAWHHIIAKALKTNRTNSFRLENSMGDYLPGFFSRSATA